MKPAFEDMNLQIPAVTAEPEDYTGEDGLLYCGKCRTPKEAYFPADKATLFGRDRHPAECDCQRAQRMEREAAEQQRKHRDKVEELKRRGFTDPAMREWTFANDNGRNPQMKTAHFYVEHWEDMKAGNIGYLLWGSVGTGKSYLAGCIANALMEKEISVRMTNFALILNDLAATFEGKNEYISNLCRYPLLILDDFGMERGTEYGLEQVYNVIDSRYRSGKPLIVTTNLTLTELQNPQDTPHARIYDRLLEMCAPVCFSGENFRIKQIYQLCLAGNGPTKIARMLTEQEIPTPGTLEYQRTGSIRRYHPGYECKWATNTVVHLLENREYTGCLVNFKTEKPSYKMKHSIDNPIEKQAIFENHHEPIIDLQTWERVQELRKQRKRPNRYDDVGLFSGLLFCADCGHVMYQQRYQTDKRKQDCYICGSYKKRTADCTAHFIRTDLLTAGVLDNLRKVTAYAQKHEARFVKLLIQQNEMGGKRKQAAATKQLEQVQSRIAELSRYIKRLYEDNVNGKINDERFMEMSADYEAEQRELKEKAAALQGELDKAQEATVNAEKFMNVVRKYLSIEELTHTLLREMVEKIVVYECEYDENEVRHQRIDIYYSFVGKIDLPEE